MDFEDIQPVISPWPVKMGQSERNEKEARDKAFGYALKLRLEGTSWCFAHETMFEDHDDWYMGNQPCLAHERGVIMCMSYKPMAIDPLFWEITGLSVDRERSLPFRNRGTYMVSAPRYFDFIGQNISEVNELADLTLEWTENWKKIHVQRLEISDMLDRLGELNRLSGPNRTLAICLLILKGDFQAAGRLCGDEDSDKNAFQKDDGGITAVNKGGDSYTFYDKARAWIATERRKNLRLV